MPFLKFSLPKKSKGVAMSDENENLELQEMEQETLLSIYPVCHGQCGLLTIRQNFLWSLLGSGHFNSMSRVVLSPCPSGRPAFQFTLMT